MSNRSPSPVILDCTLRDGGYYNGWDFEESIVRHYLRALTAAGVKVVELGYRSLPGTDYMGALGYCTDEYLSRLSLPDTLRVAAMVDAGSLLHAAEGPVAAIDALFLARSESRIEIVRVAAHSTALRQCRSMLERLKEKGYFVTLNLMQITTLDDDELRDCATWLSEIGCVDVLYFADSLGKLTPTDISPIIHALRQGWNGPLGIHAHDNRGYALANSMVAAEMGVEWIDATVLGMGRGAGNARTECLLLELEQKKQGSYAPDALFGLVFADFGKLQQKYGWGYNLLYYLSAIYDIHPTYIQEMLSNARGGTEHLIDIFEYLRSTPSVSFSQAQFSRALAGCSGSGAGTWDASGWCEGEDVLIIGAGASIERHRDALLEYIKRHSPRVLCLNINPHIPDELVTFYVACHRMRLLLEAESYRNIGRPIALPRENMPASVAPLLENIEVLDYGVKVSENCFAAASDGCVIPVPLAFGYALAIATEGRAKRILLAGFDGYEQGDPRQQEMLDTLAAYREYPANLDVLALLPTTYPVSRTSLYSPWV